MKCQSCAQAEATVHIKEVKNEQVTEMHLCEKCAYEKGYRTIVLQDKSSLASQLIWMAESLYPEGTGALGQVRCSHCGLSYSEFVQMGRLGCETCYRDFEKQLKQVLRRIHGSIRHVGKAPGKEGLLFERRRELQKLREDLERAIEREEYERAAGLRDQIRLLEAQGEAEAEPSQSAGREAQA
ncbi:MAG: UvrB/UvrC motif-containing protein [Candidatus Eisenbacteria bacterium]|uniref:UvrB/UvrC motif-containing protein n=1 Tax=Eiseniibacteriota bacterium TaxID=2212470 RepID=A0A937X7L9_UNCEI|nr:UvrB/UvrC motif-containing protein [Candidatus Eisenbacteria bacterium]